MEFELEAERRERAAAANRAEAYRGAVRQTIAEWQDASSLPGDLR
jgi:hypothetical protein